MEILELLNNNSEELLDEDLDAFETEVRTNPEYRDAYKKAVISKILQLRNWRKGERDKAILKKKEAQKKEHEKQSPYISISELTPDGVAKPEVKEKNMTESIFAAIAAMRKKDSYKEEFNKYITDNTLFSQQFVESNMDFFEPWEVSEMLQFVAFDEAFLEKYFDILDHNKISRYQLFSEEFFIKHFDDMSTNITLKESINPWRPKSERSKHLQIFLRLKGIKI